MLIGLLFEIRSVVRGQRPRALFIGLFGAALPACQEEWGPVPKPTAPVQGVVTVAGQPVPNGWIEFLPVDGTIGNLSVAPIGPDGRFQDDDVAVGRVAIRVVGAPLPAPESRALGQAYLIRRSIPAEGHDDLAIDLRQERLKRDRTQRTRP